MLIAVLSGFIVAIFAPWIYRLGRDATGWLLALLPFGLFIYFTTFIGPVSEGETLLFSQVWVSSLQINLSFYVDGLSLLFALIISGIGTLIVLYGSGYLKGHHQIDKFYMYVLMFMASMLGVVLSNNVLTLFIFWELTSLSSYLLIGYYHEEKESRAAALQALLVTGAGGLALLAGLVIVSIVGGTWEISELFNQADVIKNSNLYLLILVLVLAGAFTKSAQFPFHFWLPGAMAAPAPVSAYLHSATMVKAGVYLLARFSPILGGTELWKYSVTIFGTVTMLLAAHIAWQQTDLKRILAYSTVSALGTLVMLLGLGGEYAVEAAIVYLVVHSLYKGSLFMVAGAVDHESGTRFIDKLGGLRRAMPITAVAAILAAASMSGLPFFLGFIGKELIYEATLEGHFFEALITAAAVLTNILTIVAAWLVVIRPFFGKQVETPKHAHEAPLAMWLGPVILAGLGLLLGLFSSDALKPLIPFHFDKAIVSPGTSAILAEAAEVNLHLFPTEFSTILMLSVVTIAGGFGLYAVRDPLCKLFSPTNAITKIGPEQWYQWILDGMVEFAKLQTRFLQSGYLRYYLLTVIGTTVIVTGYTLFTAGELGSRTLLQQPDFTINTFSHYELLIYLTILAATVMVVTTQSRLAAVAALGVVGYGVALIFIFFGAPDLAMTQFSIETLSVILLVLVLYRLPTFTIFSSRANRLRDAIAALVSGAMLTVLVLVVTQLPAQSRLTPYFAENSYTQARGHNVVNVILVDFRGFDTMGEITVLSVAAIGVFGLMKLRLDRKKDADSPDLPSKDNTDIFPTLTKNEQP